VILSIPTSIVVDEERAGISNRTEELRRDGGKHSVFRVFIFLFIRQNNFLKEGAIYDGVVVEVAGEGDDIFVEEVGVDCGGARNRGEVSSISTDGRVHRRLVEVCDYGSNGTAPFLSRGGIILFRFVEGLHELPNREVAIHQAIVGAISRTTMDNAEDVEVGNRFVVVPDEVDQMLNV